QPYKFAKIINTKIISYFVEEGLPADTEYSIIVHSQGGLVAMSYLNSCFKQEKSRCDYIEGINEYTNDGLQNQISAEKLSNQIDVKEHFPTPQNIKMFITLGTPFWGSPVA